MWAVFNQTEIKASRILRLSDYVVTTWAVRFFSLFGLLNIQYVGGGGGVVGGGVCYFSVQSHCLDFKLQKKEQIHETTLRTLCTAPFYFTLPSHLLNSHRMLARRK